MPLNESALTAKQQEIYDWIIETLKLRLSINYKESHATYGFDIYLPNLINDYLRSKGGEIGPNLFHSAEGARVAPKFLDSLWEMCLRGILRPSWVTSDDQHFAGAGYGYSYTENGKKWLSDASHQQLLFSVDKMGEVFSQHRNLYGEGFHERAQEALRCYSARAYFGCCAMSGAAAESILLRMAIEKLGDDKRALQIYHGKQGRKELKDKVLELGQKADSIKNEVGTGFTILAYWRDDAAHGSALNIDSTMANVALQMLCLFSIACNKHWEALTR